MARTRERRADIDGSGSVALDGSEHAFEGPLQLAEQLAQSEQVRDCYALQWYRALTQLLPIDKAVLYNLGVLYEDLGRDQEAAACYETIARTFPADRRARLPS